MQFGEHIHVPLRIDSNNFGYPLTFHLASSSGRISFGFLVLLLKLYWVLLGQYKINIVSEE